jgi:polyisoprenyl-teichoic acid--peptidoglycan teichoic acid transferase
MEMQPGSVETEFPAGTAPAALPIGELPPTSAGGGPLPASFGGRLAPIARSRSLAAVLSFLLPGLGQLIQGRHAAALAFAVPALAMVAWLAAQLSNGLAWFALSMLDETFALGVAVVVAALGLLRVASVLAVLAVPRRRPRRVETAVAAMLLLAIVVPHGYVAATAWIAREADRGIASNNGLFAAASPSSGAAPRTSATAAPSGPVVYVPGASPTATPTPQPTAMRLPGLNPIYGDDRITFLLLGMDFMSGRSHSLTDSIMVVSLNTATGDVVLLSVPRDTAGFDYYWGGTGDPADKINNLLPELLAGSITAPDPPMEAMKKEIGFLLGIPIDYYAAIDMDGFVKMVDAVGGVDFYNPTKLDDPFSGTLVPEGDVHLDAEEALHYVRSRESTSDYDRSARQQRVVVALEHKVLDWKVLPYLGALISLAGENVATDFPLRNARDYLAYVRTATNVFGCVLGPPYSYHPDSSETGGSWTSRLDKALVANLSVGYFGTESRFWGQPGVVPATCGQ